MLRRCSRCEIDKPTTDFNKMSAARDGLQRYCRACQSVKFKEHRDSNYQHSIERVRAYQRDNAESISAQRKLKYAENREALIAISCEYRRNNPEKVGARMAKYRKEKASEIAEVRRRHRQENAEAIAEYDKQYRASNRPKIRQINAKRRAAKAGASVGWANKDEIERIYLLAEQMTKTTGVEHQVDHIVPLVSDLVCGLHCESNLQVMPKAENISKGNRHWPDMPE